jgi:exo-1,4-beta-D-glucosaminidase
MKKILGLFLLMVMITMPGRAVRTTYVLQDGWTVEEGGHTYHTSIPVTAMGVLLGNGVYTEDVLSGLNYKQLDRSRFDHPWSFCKQFSLPPLRHGQHVFLKIDGLSFSANIFVNGSQVATRDTVRGPFRQYMLDITRHIKSVNELRIELYKAENGDPNIGYVDWNPRPVDESMGIFRMISLEIVDDVLMQNTAVFSKVNTETLKEAWLTVETELSNLTGHTVKGSLVGHIGKDISIRFPVTLRAGERRKVTITPDDVRRLHVLNPRLWWCNNMGKPEMYDLSLRFEIGTELCDDNNISFGIREVKDYLTPEGYRGFMLNGRKVLIRGAGWTDDIFIRDTPERYRHQIEMVKDMHLNTIRLENIWGNTDDLFNLCDRNGILMFAGWSCQWEWAEYAGGKMEDKYGSIDNGTNMNLLVDQLHDQVLYLRNHPSIICWFIGSDKLPRPELEQRYRGMLSLIDNRPILCSAQHVVSEVSGTSGVKMFGPYEYVGPSYWYEDSIHGGAYGFNTETGIGAQLPIRESIQRMIPADKLWPVNDNEYYNYHCTASKTAMNSLSMLTDVINRRFGGADSLDDYLKKADLLNYDGTRAMFESFRARIPQTTGIIQWMLNSAWPSLYWQLYDFYGVPTAAYYSVKAANKPLQLIYDYAGRCVYAVNESATTARVMAKMNLYDIHASRIQHGDTLLTVVPYTSVKVFDVKDALDISFLFLKLSDADNRVVATNEYCLTSQKDEYDWKKSTWYYTPMTQTASLSSLSSLPMTKLEMTTRRVGDNVEVDVTNHSATLSFFNSLILKRADGQAVAYAKWDNNYFTLLPGETRRFVCSFPPVDGPLTVTLRGWNTNAMTAPLLGRGPGRSI